MPKWYLTFWFSDENYVGLCISHLPQTDYITSSSLFVLLDLLALVFG
jgi:hypothetical protein